MKRHFNLIILLTFFLSNKTIPPKLGTILNIEISWDSPPQPSFPEANPKVIIITVNFLIKKTFSPFNKTFHKSQLHLQIHQRKPLHSAQSHRKSLLQNVVKQNWFSERNFMLITSLMTLAEKGNKCYRRAHKTNWKFIFISAIAICSLGESRHSGNGC